MVRQGLIISVLTSLLFSTTLYVPANYTTIQAGIDASVDGDTVLVQPGTYLENINYNGKNITVGSLFLTTQDTSYITSTIIDGNQTGSVVRFENAEERSACISGVTIKNGMTLEPLYGFKGGGIYCDDSSPTIDHAIIANNYADNGGGISINLGAPLITNTIVRNNEARNGIGIFCVNTNALLSRVVIYSNHPIASNGVGGGIYIMDGGVSQLSVYNCTIVENTAGEKGGGLYINGSSAANPLIVNTIIANNSGEYGIYCYSGNPIISYSNLWNNELGGFYNCGQQYGYNNLVNTNGDSCDIYYNINTNPFFVEIVNSNFNLQFDSKCIDAGDPNVPYDPDGSIADIGAYSSPYGERVPIVINVPSDFSSIQAGLNTAQLNDTVLVQPGTYTENIIWPETHGIKLISAGDSSNTIIDGGGVSSVIYMNPQTAIIDTTTLIQGFQITNGGNVSNGGGMMLSGSSPIFAQTKVSYNSATTNGGGMHLTNSSNPKFQGVRISDNSASMCGGLSIINSSHPNLIDVIISNNTATGNSSYSQGGGIHINSSNPFFQNVIISGNCSYGQFGEGGGIYIRTSNSNFTDVTIINNLVNGSIGSRGGGVHISYGAFPTFSGVIIAGNKALDVVEGGDGGGIYSENSSQYFDEVTIYNNYVNGNGGGAYFHRTGSNITGVFIARNIADDSGGGLFFYDSDVTLTTLSITGNSASFGGGVFEDYSDLSLNELTITNNYSNSLSGAIHLESGNPIISQSNFLGNSNSVNNIDNSNFIAAINNYWGHSSGPYHPSQNPTGLGDSVNTFVNVTPWLTTPNTDAPPIPAQNVTVTSTGNDFVSLSWDSSPLGDFAGFKVYFDTDSSGYPYTNSIDVGADTSYTLSSLALGTEYFIAVTVYDTDGNESWYSNEVTGVTRVLQANNIDIAGDEDLTHIVTHAPAISWQYFDSMGEVQTHYQVQVSTSGDFSSADIWDSGETASADTSAIYSGSELIDGTTYYLRVKVGSSGFWSDWSTLTFRMNTEPTVSVPVYPINDQVSGTPVILKATNSTDPESDDLVYSFNVYTDGTLTTKLDSAIAVTEGADTTTWQVTTSLPDNEQYFWTVSASDGYESSLISDTVSFLLNSANDIPAEFALLTPADSSDVTTLRPSLDWESAYDPDPLDTVKYTLYLDTPAPGILTYSMDTVTIFTPDFDLQDNTTYHWRVVAIDLAGTTRENTGSYQSFRVNTSNDLPGDFALLSPENGIMVADLTPTFSWNIPVDPDDTRQTETSNGLKLSGDIHSTRSILSYTVWLGTDTSFSDNIGDVVETNQYTPLSDLQENQIYCWQVEAIDNDMGTTLSAIWSFWTNSTNSTPAEFTLLTPTADTETDLLPTFSWTASSDEDLNDSIRYTLSYGTDVQNLIAINTGSQTFFTPTADLTDNSTYVWNVTATDVSGATFTTGFRTFTVNSTNDYPGMFTLVGPDSGSVVHELTVNLIWDVATDDDGDQLSYAVHFGTEPTPATIDTVSANYFQANGLTEGSVYYWQVVALDTLGGTSVSETWSFTVNASNSAPADFALLLPAASEELATLTSTFYWTHSADVDLNDEVAYSLYIADDTSETSYPGLADTVFTLTEALAENGTYEWWVVAIDLSGATTENSDGPRNFTVNTGNDAPTVPELRAPLNASFQTNLDPAFYWSASVDADPNDIVSYYIKAWSDATVHDGIVEDSTWFQFNLPGGLLDNSYYEWYVSATDQTEEVLSDTGYFWTDAFPEPPMAFNTVYPADGETGLGSDILFTWNSTVDPDPMDQVAYTLVYATNWDDSLTYNYVTAFGDTSVLVSLDDNAEYYWTVIASDNDSLVTAANNGTPSSLVVGVLSVDEDVLPIEFSLHQNYPNPFNPTTQLRYDLPEQAFVQLSIYDLLGRQVTTLVNQVEEPGYRSVQWNGTDSQGKSVSAGMYLYVIKAGDFVQTRKMVLLK